MAIYTFLISAIIFIIGLLFLTFGGKNKLILISVLIITILSGLWFLFCLFLMIIGPF
jgi:hypothetical protein